MWLAKHAPKQGARQAQAPRKVPAGCCALRWEIQTLTANVREETSRKMEVASEEKYPILHLSDTCQEHPGAPGACLKSEQAPWNPWHWSLTANSA